MSSTLKILKSHGYDGTLNDFRDILAVTLHNLYPNWSGERLTYNPDQAKVYCQTIRDAVKLPKLSNESILSALGNARKHPVAC